MGAMRPTSNSIERKSRARRWLHVMWSQPWFFVIACLHLGQGLVWPPARSLRISSLNRSSAWAFSIDLRWNSEFMGRHAHAIDAGSPPLVVLFLVLLPLLFLGHDVGTRSVVGGTDLPAHEGTAQTERLVALGADE